MKSLYELTTDANVTSWIPADVYADLILEASVCYGQLSGKGITAIDYNMSAGEGDTIQVRYFPARTAQGPLTSCACLSVVSSTLGTYPITIAPYGDYDRMCGFSLFKAKGPVKEGILREMAKGLARARDIAIWTAITVLAPGHTVDLGHAWEASVVTDACCFNAIDLYNAIVYLYKQMQGGALNPDYVIMHPEVAAHLYYKDAGQMPLVQSIMPLLKWDGNGQLIKVGPLKVIECCNASQGTNASNATMAVVIDSSRAVGEAWGKRPTFYEDFVIECDYYKEVIWMYWGTAAMDTNAIGHILNP